MAAYYPEANVLVPLDYIDKESGTPSYKAILSEFMINTSRLIIIHTQNKKQRRAIY